MFDEIATAFILICTVSSLIYILGRLLSPKPIKSEAGQSTYACGEKATFPKLRINVSLYKYLIYFMILDSSVLLVAFASFVVRAMNILLFTFYLFIVLISNLLLLDGGKE